MLIDAGIFKVPHLEQNLGQEISLIIFFFPQALSKPMFHIPGSKPFLSPGSKIMHFMLLSEMLIVNFFCFRFWLIQYVTQILSK